MKGLALIVLFGLSLGCVSARWTRTSRFEPVSDELQEELAVGDDLTPWLERLGAPLWVWEYEGDGVALAYGWYQDQNWNVNVSVPVTNDASASFDYTQIDARMRGLVLFFDGDYRLRAWRQGLLTDITQGLRRRRPNWNEETG